MIALREGERRITMSDKVSKLSAAELDLVAGGNIEDLEEIRSILLQKYPDIPEIGVDPKGAYDYIESVLRLGYDIDMWVLKDGPNRFDHIERALRKTPMTYDEVISYLKANL